MAERLDLFLDMPEDIFKQSYNTYQVPSHSIPSHRPYYIPAIRSRHDAIEINDFLVQQIAGFPQYSTEYVPQYSSGRTLYPTLDIDYAQPSDMAPSTNLYPQLFGQTPSPSSNYVGMGSRMSYEQNKVVSSGTLQKAPPPRAGSEELVQVMEKMDVDSEARDKKPEEEVIVKVEEKENKPINAKHLEVIKKLQKMVQEMILDWDNENEVKVEKASPVMESASISAQ
jgi:hypothetical protein